MKRSMKPEHQQEPSLSQLMSGHHCLMPLTDPAPACVGDGGDIPYGHLLGGEEAKLQIIFTDSVRHLYLTTGG